ncbi:hypothetical protein BL250_08710 [Erwinia sp. OLTSP20]|nr:hypothetical protein BV501_10265 [Erwinia sp. OAMSP11]PIJ72461.1 hypothetical protein BK416_09525 [Erwinia sp. OLSSP12]PIJ80084.1 hypothetical protein BLD47_12095 [Erwinia sp. OLCASP19]PIJ82174.1 hypothetical protein BLD46_11640 [Erwinia sp. OLMTSP26]PIJ86410.1 hypothetical protein BLD49_08335 [Erwinia sp. OLMDSP33]PIJ89771.1 hypothetical protein BL249_15135 [Erwinia sp. OLFS4]PIJ92705.1 hypothetical protein BL250_08710 [Erwinia sp. OLTSP20]
MTLYLPDDGAPALPCPLFLETVSCGFPSPARDYIEQELDLNDYCIAHPAATYFLRASGSSMQDIGLYDGDLLVVDRALTPGHGDIVVAETDGEFTVKRLLTSPRLTLKPMNPAYPELHPDPDRLEIFGVVIHFIHTTRGRN